MEPGWAGRARATPESGREGGIVVCVPRSPGTGTLNPVRSPGWGDWTPCEPQGRSLRCGLSDGPSSRLGPWGPGVQRRGHSLWGAGVPVPGAAMTESRQLGVYATMCRRSQSRPDYRGYGCQPPAQPSTRSLLAIFGVHWLHLSSLPVPPTRLYPAPPCVPACARIPLLIRTPGLFH